METDSDRIGKGINPESSSVETDFLTLDRHQRRFQETGGIQVSFRPNPAVSAGGSDETPGIQWGKRGDWGQKEIRNSGCHGFTVFGKEVASSFDKTVKPWHSYSTGGCERISRISRIAIAAKNP